MSKTMIVCLSVFFISLLAFSIYSISGYVEDRTEQCKNYCTNKDIVYFDYKFQGNNMICECLDDGLIKLFALEVEDE